MVFSNNKCQNSHNSFAEEKNVNFCTHSFNVWFGVESVGRPLSVTLYRWLIYCQVFWDVNSFIEQTNTV